MVAKGSSLNLTRSLVTEIGGSIVRGEYSEGQNLPTEAKLSENFGASRSVTREAVKMLTAKGLVKSWPRRGTVVQGESDWNLLDPDVLEWTLGRPFALPLLVDFLDMRLAIEPEAAGMAARRKADTTEIAEALEHMKRADVGAGDPLEADSAFHTAILRASGNRFFAQMAPLVDTALKMTIRLTNRMRGVSIASVDDHEKIFNAIDSGDEKAAIDLSKKMIVEAISLIKRHHENAK